MDVATLSEPRKRRAWTPTKIRVRNGVGGYHESNKDIKVKTEVDNVEMIEI